MTRKEFIELIGQDLVVDYPFGRELQRWSMKNFYIDKNGEIKYRYGIRPNYNDGRWYKAKFKYYNPYAPVVNTELALKLFPYSALNYFTPDCPIVYLRTYRKYPQAEYLIKAGLEKLVRSKMILELIGKDKKFCKWLMANKKALYENPYYIGVIISSYKTGKSLDELQAYKEAVIILKRQRNLPVLQKAFRNEIDKLIDYVSAHKTGVTTYNDYYTACNYLGLDMTIPKNRYPLDFKRWHDIRIKCLCKCKNAPMCIVTNIDA